MDNTAHSWSWRGLQNEYGADSEENVGVTEHVRFSFIQPVDCSTSWSPGLLSESLAREPWREKNWGLISITTNTNLVRVVLGTARYKGANIPSRTLILKLASEVT
uniref:Uncharacterized protein n=1 Tax=Timema monikensis TaxID=170555 RepID=A0A7R9ELD9_9NEOP|nr:unnamed protein product [Timema monikensis]